MGSKICGLPNPRKIKHEIKRIKMISQYMKNITNLFNFKINKHNILSKPLVHISNMAVTIGNNYRFWKTTCQTCKTRQASGKQCIA